MRTKWAALGDLSAIWKMFSSVRLSHPRSTDPTGSTMRPADAPLRPQTYRVALEGAVFALINVHQGHEEEFEAWYGLDHFYSGGVLGPGVLSGKRWVRQSRAQKPEVRCG
jgi:hypothetical protein